MLFQFAQKFSQPLYKTEIFMVYLGRNIRCQKVYFLTAFLQKRRCFALCQCKASPLYYDCLTSVRKVGVFFLFNAPRRSPGRF